MPEKSAYEKAEFSVSFTVKGLLPPVGSPVEPGPLLVMLIVNGTFCWP